MVRQIRQILQGQKVTEGAGVHLHRVFGFTHPEQFDPFLLLDDFRSPNREDFIMGSTAKKRRHDTRLCR